MRAQRQTDPSSRQTTAPNAAPLALSDHPLPRLIPAARLVLTDSATHWLALPTDLAAWSRLTRLLTLGKRRAPKGQCQLARADLYAGCHGMILIALPPDPLQAPLPDDLRAMLRHFPGQCYLGAAPRYDGRDPARLAQMAAWAQATGLPMVALGDVLMHSAARRPLADVLTCLRLGLTIDSIGQHRLPHAEHRLKGGAEMARMFRDHPAALRRTSRLPMPAAFGFGRVTLPIPRRSAKRGTRPSPAGTVGGRGAAPPLPRRRAAQDCRTHHPRVAPDRGSGLRPPTS